MRLPLELFELSHPGRPALGPGGRPRLWREARVGLEAAALVRDPVFRGVGVQDGGGQPVLLIPGFLAGDESLALMSHWLRRTGHRSGRAGMRLNVGCSGATVERLEHELERLVALQGRPAAIVGQSRGGYFAKVLARKRPELVLGVIALGSPLLDPFAIHPFVRLQVQALGALGTLGAPGLFRRACLDGDCCAEFWAQSLEPPPDGVGYVSVYSRSDGVVDWRACLDPHARQVEVSTSHMGMAASAQVYRAVAGALAEFRRPDLGHRPGPRPISRLADAA